MDAPAGPRLAVLFVHAPGDEWVPPHELEAHAAAYGEAAARLHNACDDFTSDQPRFALDLVHLLDRPLATFEPFLRDRPDDDRYLRALVASSPREGPRLKPRVVGVSPWAPRLDGGARLAWQAWLAHNKGQTRASQPEPLGGKNGGKNGKAPS